MQGKIGLEEHFAIPETLNDSKGYLGDNVWPELEKRLMDIQEYRLRQMDAHGMEMMILSLNAPAVQAIHDPKKAVEIAPQKLPDVFRLALLERFGGSFEGFALLLWQPDGQCRGPHDAENTLCLAICKTRVRLEQNRMGFIQSGFAIRR